MRVADLKRFHSLLICAALQPVILLTQVDTLDERIKTDKSLLFSSGLVMSAREVASMKTGVPVDRVLPVSGVKQESYGRGVAVVHTSLGGQGTQVSPV